MDLTLPKSHVFVSTQSTSKLRSLVGRTDLTSTADGAGSAPLERWIVPIEIADERLCGGDVGVNVIDCAALRDAIRCHHADILDPVLNLTARRRRSSPHEGPFRETGRDGADRGAVHQHDKGTTLERADCQRIPAVATSATNAEITAMVRQFRLGL